MNHITPWILTFAIITPAISQEKKAMSLHQFTVNTLDGHPKSLSAYKGKVALVVNVASECGFTPQYEGLQKLSTDYKDKGLVVLAFPCNQFGGQEPGTPEQIQQFCSTKFHVTFPMFEKLDVKGPHQAPLYAFLTAKHGEPKWNFSKYLVGKDGQVVAAFPSQTTPEASELRMAIDAALK